MSGLQSKYVPVGVNSVAVLVIQIVLLANFLLKLVQIRQEKMYQDK